MLDPYGFNGKWFTTPTGRVIHPVEVKELSQGLKFYEVRPHPSLGNPVIIQPRAGNIYLTILGTKLIVCEEENLYNEALEQIHQYRVLRRSLDNPKQISPEDPIYLGEIYSNSQRIMGAPEKLYLVRLVTPPDGRYVFRSVREVFQTRDGIGIAAVAKALERGLVQLE